MSENQNIQDPQTTQQETANQTGQVQQQPVDISLPPETPPADNLPQQNTPPPVQSPIPQPTTPPPQKNNAITIIGLVLMLISFLALAGYVFTHKETVMNKLLPDKTSISPTQAPTNSPTPTTTEIESAWKTYSSPTYQFKYPDSVQLKENEDSIITISMSGPTQTEATELFDGFSVSFQTNETANQDLESYINNLIDEINKEGVIKVIDGPSAINIGNYNGLTFTEEGLGTIKQNFLQSDDKTLVMQISVIVEDPGNLGFQETINQILSTFKFTSQ